MPDYSPGAGIHTRALRPRRAVLDHALWFLLIAGCAGPTLGRDPRTSVRVEPASPSSTDEAVRAGRAFDSLHAVGSTTPELPQLPGDGRPALSSAHERRLLEVDIPEGTPIASAVTQIGKLYGLTVAVDPGVQGTTRTNLRDVTLREALDDITRNGARYQLQGNVLRVVPVRMETRTFALDYVALSRIGTMSTVVQRRLVSGDASATPGGPALGGSDGLVAQSVADVWSDIRVSLTGLMQAGQKTGASSSQAEAGSVLQASADSRSAPQASSTPFSDGSVLIISPSAGLITVTAFPDKIAAVDAYLGRFQASILRQVMITAKIVEVRLDRSFQFGIDWVAVTNAASRRFGVVLRNDPSVTTTGTAGNVNFTFTGGATTINAVLSALQSQGDVNVLSNEQTSALNNQRAIFQVTSDEVFFSVNRIPLIGPNGGVVSVQSSVTPQQIAVGVILDVLPQISADNVLTMDIRPSVTNITSIASISLPDGTSASAPTIARREGDTIARLRAGETMMIGGLVQTRMDRTVSGVPILKDIPLVGKAFQRVDNRESRTELVVFLTPTIISGQPAAGR